MPSVSHNVQPERFAATQSRVTDFQLFTTNVVSYLAAGTTFFIAIIILSRRIVGGLAFHPPIFILLLVTITGGILIAAATQPWLRWNSTLHRLSRLTRFNVFVVVLTLGIWLPILTFTNVITVVLLGAVVFLPSRRSKHKQLVNTPLRSYSLFIEDSRRAIYKNVVTLLRLNHTHRKPLRWPQRRAPLWRQVFLQEKSGNEQQVVPLQEVSNDQIIHPGTTRTGSDNEEILLHWQERYELPDGTEHLRGQLIVNLPTGTRLATGHVGFCPSFPFIPTVEVTTEFDALEVSVTAAEILPWGVRIECRVEEPIDEQTSVPVSISVNKPSESPIPQSHHNEGIN